MTKKRTRSAIGRQNRARGGAYERFVADRLRAVFPGARRGIGQARSGGEVPDVEGCAPYWPQLKNTRSPNLFVALEQAEEEMRTRRLQGHAPSPYSVPLAVARRTGKIGDVVALRLDDFVALLARQVDALNESAAREAKLLAELATMRIECPNGEGLPS